MSIDCLFEMLDFYQWKYNKDCWSCLNKLILKSEKIDSIKECINENWLLRKNYWIPYHFTSFTCIYEEINQNRFSIGLMLMGPSHNFVKTASKICSFDLVNYAKELEVYNWLFS
ncbi:unnamed protein product [Brachionus calyciflorus]|uniref:Uncharacterized protein n=1 Tax=Brachionus calyciflorus TaxID=104777 RepID=A0A814RZD0_9BILA|nr:unnamed protein product [Brachionus calyciflorus]CAF1140024.1 unnamed protein product [Brachionus calyciflorus]